MAAYYLGVNEISLVFYGDLSEVKNHLLYQLNFLKLLPATENYFGFYAIESRYGREIPKKISLKPGIGEAVLLYRYLCEADILALESSSEATQFYILAHKFFDKNYIKNEILTRIAQACFISDFPGGANIHSFRFIKNEYNPRSILQLKSVGQNSAESIQGTAPAHLPVFFLLLLKIFMNPFAEVRHYSVLIKYSNLRILSRALELFLAMEFVINAVFLKLFRLFLLRMWYSSNRLVGLGRVVLINTGFAIRHVFLMAGFKSYGVFVDIYFTVVRFFLNVFHFLFYRVLFFLFYRVLFFLFYRVLFFLFYRVLFFLFYRVLLKGKFLVRHVLLISFFRVYGLIFDFCTYSFRFVKLILLYPFFKIYWFMAFQYKKRIKKQLS